MTSINTEIQSQETLSGIDSLVLFKNSQDKSGRGTLIHITRTGVVFEVYNPYSIVQLSEVLPVLQIVRGDRIIYKGRGVVSHLLTTGLMIIVSITLVDPWSDLHGLKPGGELGLEAKRFVEDWTRSNRIIPKYQHAVSCMRNFLGEISRWLDEAEAGITEGPDTRISDEMRDEFFEEVSPPIEPQFNQLFADFETAADQVPPEELNIHKSFARRELHPLTLCSPFVSRSYAKPLGYAGDYEMVNMMLLESTTKPTSIYAKIVDTFHIKAAAPMAHRNRVVMLEERLNTEAERVVTEEERIFTVLNMGCGPASEVRRFIRGNDIANQTSLRLMDFNEETLNFTESKVKSAINQSGNKPIVTFVNKSIDELLQEIQEDSINTQETFDMVYCAGLFDYFSDQICKRLVALFYSWTKPNGLVTVTNVHSRNPNKKLMEHLLEWYLVYRDDNGMANLAPNESNFEVSVDSTEVNVFLDIRKDP